MKGGTLKIHTENILPIIKKWLYSDKEIFVRELVSNASDALTKAKHLGAEGPLQIEVSIDKEQKTLTISDTGIGMQAEEVEKYIAQIAFSGAEEFISKYTEKKEGEPIIGHFGLGFYSSYMVAKKVEIDTLSYQEKSEPVFWSCDGSVNYLLGQGKRTSRGTSVTLFIDQESEEFLDEARLEQILKRYCAFLPYPILLGGKKINESEPLFTKPAAQCTDEEYLRFYRELYPLERDPIFWVHLSVDYPFHLQGILYFPHIQQRFDWSQSAIKLFCNRVFVSDSCKDLLPDFLACLRGALDSPDIPLNVSRSHLQMDRSVRQLGTHVCKKIADRLHALYENERDRFLSSWSEIEIFVKLGVLQDDKFYERVKQLLVWKTLEGKWTTLDEYRAAHGDKIFYATEGQNANCVALYRAQGIEVLVANGHIDNGLMSFLESRESGVKFQRIDGAIDSTILDEKREKTLTDAEGKTEAAQIADFIREAIGSEQVTVEAKSFASDTLPAMIVRDEELRRMRDYMALAGQPLPPTIANRHTFVVNTNSRLISAIHKLREQKPELAKQIAEHLYELSLLSYKELSQEVLPQFVERANTILEKLVDS